jgi:non-ribosomal peptide synthetase component F/acyl carrier protein
VIGIWKEVLGIEAVGIDEDFFDLGGHSLLATQVISRVREVFQVEVPAQQLFLEPTVEGLATYVDSARSTGFLHHDLTIKPITDDRNLPLSFAQQRLWFLDQLEPGNRAYNVGMAIRLTGRLKIGVLEQCLNETIRRHQSLRTNFVETDGRPVQVINKVENFPIHLVELRQMLRHAGDEIRDKVVERLVGEEGARSFDLAKGRLLRVTLLQLTDNEQALLLTMHHIVSDGWSMGLLTTEIAALYEAFSIGNQSSLSELTIQYADFAAWQRARLDGKILDDHLAYWTKQLAGELPRIDLPTDRPRSATRSFRGATESTVFPISLSQSLKAASKREEVTLFMTLLAGFKTLLYRYTGQEDVIVGTGIANRNRSETEAMIGFFVNMLVLRTDLSSNPTFKDILARVRKVMLGAYAHEDMPFERLVEMLRPNRKVSTTPLFQVVFVLHNLPPLSLSLPGITLTPINLKSELTHFDMSVEIGDETDGLLVTVTYNTDLFDRSTINRFIRHYETVLTEVAKDLELRLLEIPLSLEGLESNAKTAAALDPSYRNDRFTFNLNQ